MKKRFRACGNCGQSGKKPLFLEDRSNQAAFAYFLNGRGDAGFEAGRLQGELGVKYVCCALCRRLVRPKHKTSASTPFMARSGGSRKFSRLPERISKDAIRIESLFGKPK